MARASSLLWVVCLSFAVAGGALAQDETADESSPAGDSQQEQPASPATAEQEAAEAAEDAAAAAEEAAAAAREAVEAARAAVEAVGDEVATPAAGSQPAADQEQQGEEGDRDGDDRRARREKRRRARADRSDEPATFCSGELCLQPKLRLRLRYDAIEQDTQVDYIGRNNGFGLSSGRLGLRGEYGRWVGFNVTMDGGFVEQTDRNLVGGTTFAALKDAWVQIKPWDFILVRAGQFKTPFDEESLRSTAELRFVDRSVGDRGIRSGEGYQVLGASPARNLGLMAGAEDLRLGPFGLQYLAAVVNGNGENQAYNDNSAPAVFGRLALSAFDAVGLGVGGVYNPRTVGALPNLYDEIDAGFTVDAHAMLFGAYADASFLWINTQYPTTGAPDSVAMAASAEVGYTLWFGLGAGYRFGWYDPTSTFGNDAVVEHTVGIRYDVPRLPLALIVDYTIALEQPGRELANNRLGALLQLNI
ncbi:MAG: hypothetical protein JXR83_11175 [Deltaproteobacteria bacterium]|nr:hypothetical protein [Deltaproteobacteria bacterium]